MKCIPLARLNWLHTVHINKHKWRHNSKVYKLYNSVLKTKNTQQATEYAAETV
jgi:hypothetical protein